MADKPQPAAGESLNGREERILRFVVEGFVATGVPVGSRTVSKLEEEHLSAASIRNTMNDLEDAGYLYQPHVSAGRVPTDLGYRYYVDRLMDPPALPLAEQKAIKTFFSSYRGVVGAVLAHTSRLLSRFSHYVGIVSAPHFEGTVFRHIDFVRQGPGRVLVIFVSQAGLVHNRMIEVDVDLDPDELNRIAAWVIEKFCGMTLVEMRNRVEEILRTDRAALDRLSGRALEFSEATFAEGFGDDGIYVEGTANIFGEPDFANPAQLKLLMQAIEEKDHLLRILNGCLSGEGVRVVIGSESELSEIQGCSLVASAYNFPDGSRGSIAVLGPTRMSYPRTVYLVDLVSKQISKFPS